jgi:hypothetical protein
MNKRPCIETTAEFQRNFARSIASPNNRAARRAASAVERKTATRGEGRVFDRWGRSRTETIAGLARLGVNPDEWDITLTCDGVILQGRNNG